MEMELKIKDAHFRSQSRSNFIQQNDLLGGNLGLRSVLGGLALTFFFILPFTAFAGTLRKPPNNLGLVAYWSFDENGGTTAGDASGNGHTGTLKGTVLPSWSAGKLGGALSFSMAPSKVTFPAITTGTTNTVSGWIYLTTDCIIYGTIFSQDQTNGLYCYQDSYGNNKLDFWYPGTPADHYSDTPLSLNRWYHVAIVNNAGSATFYLNGAADGTVSSVLSFNANTMGGDTANETLPGKIDEVRLYNRALSASDVLALYKSGATRIGNTTSYKSPGTLANGLTSYYTFDGKDMIRNVADVTGQRNARLVGYTSTTTAPGKVGQALTFDGINDYVNGAAIGNYLSSATGTVSVWLRPTGNATNIATASSIYRGQAAVSCSCIASFGISRANRTDLGQDRIWVWEYPSPQIGITYNMGEWTHVTLVHANGVLYAYKNGDLVGSAAAAGSFPTFSGTLTIGTSWTGTGGYWRGDLDEVRTYNRDLSAAEIKQLYNLTLGTKVNKPSVNSLTNGLVGYWTFDGGDTDWSTNTIINRGSAGGTATLVNMSTTTSPVAGKVGQGLMFTAANSQSVDLGTSARIQPSGNFSVSLWYKGLRGTTETFISSGPTFGNYWDISNNIARFATISPGVTNSYILPNDNDWHHLSVVLDRAPAPNTLTVYIDGVSQGTATGTLNGQDTAGIGGMNIGKGTWASGGYRQGPMDEIRIYNRTLSAAEVLQLYRLGK